MTGSCSICISEPDTPVCPPCGHVYCSACLDNHIASYTTIEQGVHTSWCPNCRVRFPLGEPDSNLHHVPLKFRPFITSAVRRLFPGEGSGEPEPESRGSEGIRKLKRLLKSKSKANYRRRKEIERLNDALRVARDGEHKAKDDRAVCQRENYRLMDTLRVARDREQKAKDDRAACQRENYRLMDELRSERQRDPLKELDPDLKVVFGIGLLTVGVIMICLMVIAFKVIKKIPFQTLFNWCMIFLRHALNTMYRHWVEHGYPLLLQLLEHCSDPELTEGKDGQT